MKQKCTQSKRAKSRMHCLRSCCSMHFSNKHHRKSPKATAAYHVDEGTQKLPAEIQTNVGPVCQPDAPRVACERLFVCYHMTGEWGRATMTDHQLWPPALLWQLAWFPLHRHAQAQTLTLSSRPFWSPLCPWLTPQWITHPIHHLSKQGDFRQHVSL